MTAILAKPSDALWDRYVKLTPSLQRLLRLKCLLVPAVTKAEFVDCLRITESRTPERLA